MESEETGMISLERADRLAGMIKERLKPYCSKIEIAGSTRRRKPWVKDIDFVAIPSDLWRLQNEIDSLGPRKVAGPKIMRVMAGEIQIDVYFATVETWGMLFLVKTGSAGNNIRLATLAKRRGWRFAASGDGLFNETGERIAGDTERSIYDALGVLWQEPAERS